MMYSTPKEYYEFGTEVKFFHLGNWIDAKIINGYRSRDGIINLELKDGSKFCFGETRHREYIKLK